MIRCAGGIVPVRDFYTVAAHLGFQSAHGNGQCTDSSIGSNIRSSILNSNNGTIEDACTVGTCRNVLRLVDRARAIVRRCDQRNHIGYLNGASVSGDRIQHRRIWRT